MFLSRYVLKRSIFVRPSIVYCNFLNYHDSSYQKSAISYPKSAIIPTVSVLHSSILYRFTSTAAPLPQKPPTLVQKLKTAVKDYGFTVVVFHVALSLVSLGCCYLAIYSGLNLMGFIQSTGSEYGDRVTAVAEGAGTFVVAYAVHKVFAPVRISITLGTAPFIVRYLRNKGILKPPKTK